MTDMHTPRTDLKSPRTDRPFLNEKKKQSHLSREDETPMGSEPPTEGNSQVGAEPKEPADNLFSAQTKLFNFTCIFWVLCCIIGIILMSSLFSNKHDHEVSTVEEDAEDSSKPSSGFLQK